jgi:hypothetical protein
LANVPLLFMTKRHEEILAEMAEANRAIARSLRERAASGRDGPADALKAVRAAARLEDEARRSLALKARLEADRRRHEFGIGSLRAAVPPTSTRH